MKKAIPREQALASTKDLLEHGYRVAMQSDKAMGSLLIAFPKGVIPTFERDGSLKSVALVPDGSGHIHKLLSEANESVNAFDAVLAWASAHLVNSGSIPDKDVRAFVAAHLLDKKKRPTKGGRRSREARHQQRHALLRHAVAQLEGMGFTATRGDASDHQDSACDIVAEAMAQLRFSPQSFNHIKEILSSGDRVGFS